MTVRKQGKSFPKYQIHKASNRAFVWWRDKRYYLGVASCPESFEAYNQFIAEIARTKGLFNPTEKAEPSNPSKRSVLVVDLMAAYLTKVESELSKKEFENICYSFRPLRKLFGHTLVDQFGPKALKQIRQTMIDEGLARKVINQRVGRIKRLFKYGVSEELVPSAVLHALQSVDGLRFGRTGAPEKAPILPVADEQVDLVMPFFPTLRLQWSSCNA